MVSSFYEKPISKSYVRLPGSGSDKEAGATFCDLSRGSSLAASISVPQNIDMKISINAKLASPAQNKGVKTEDDTSVTNEPNKRLCIDNTDQNVARTASEHTFKPVTVSTAPVPVSSQEFRSNIEQIRESQDPTQDYNFRNAVPDMKKLQEENDQLKSENANLHKQLSLFKQLMRNPQRLQSVLQRLNERQN